MSKEIIGIVQGRRNLSRENKQHQAQQKPICKYFSTLWCYNTEKCKYRHPRSQTLCRNSYDPKTKTTETSFKYGTTTTTNCCYSKFTTTTTTEPSVVLLSTIKSSNALQFGRIIKIKHSTANNGPIWNCVAWKQCHLPCEGTTATISCFTNNHYALQF